MHLSYGVLSLLLMAIVGFSEVGIKDEFFQIRGCFFTGVM
jgi:hypothetical protein